jgi:ubiquinone/menaquinone biosynthesis C-methylase UbiE
MKTEKADPFAEKAAEWDTNPTRVALAEAVVAALRAQLLFAAGWRVMEFGAGTGLVTLQLAPLVRHIDAVDASGAMLARLAEKAQQQNLPQVSCVCADGETHSLPDGPYNAIVSAMALHHVRDTQRLLQALHARLQPGGWLGLADLDAEDGSFHPDATGVFHNGFARTALQAQLGTAGFREIVFHDAWCVRKPAPGGTREYPVFLAVARRA